MSFSEAAIKYRPWSLSKAQSAMYCPFRFQHSYLLKTKGKQPKDQSATRIGKAAHAALENVLKGKQVLQDALRKAALNHKLTTVEIDDLFAMAYNMQAFLTGLEKFRETQGVTDQYVEKKFGFTLEMKPTAFFGKDVFFRGVWDLCLRVGNRLAIIDHKSGKPKNDIGWYVEQLNTYAVAGVYLFDEVEGVQSGINYVQDDDKVRWNSMQTTDYIHEHIVPWFIRFIDRAAEEATKTEARKGWWCNYCAYIDLCPLTK